MSADRQHVSPLITGGGILRAYGREFSVPFRMVLVCDGHTQELLVNQVLRFIPQKRLVCAGVWLGRPVVAKVFFAARRSRNHVAREVRGIEALQRAGIRTPALLFHAELTNDNTPVLGFERLIMARSFSRVLSEVHDKRERLDLLKRLITIIAGQHDAGLKQDDLHLGNFLLEKEALYTIDGDEVDVSRAGSPLPEDESLRNLGLFFAQFFPQQDVLIPEIFRVYIEKRGWNADSWREMRLALEIGRHRKIRMRKYLNKIFRESSAHVCLKDRSSFLICDRHLYTPAMIRFLSDPDALISESPLLKDGNSSTVALVTLDGRQLVVKRYNIKNPWHAVKRALRPTRAWVSWKNAHRLALLGINTPRPVLLLERRRGPLRSTSYFVTEYVAGVDAYRLLHKQPEDIQMTMDLANQFGELLQMFADARLSHGDFKATNFLVANGKLSVIDIDGMRAHQSMQCFRRAFERDCERLLKNWADLPQILKRFQAQLAQFQIKMNYEG